MNRVNLKERVGVDIISRITHEELGWIFREQSIVDVGIDGMIEIVIDNQPTGNLIGVQIKNGNSNFNITKSNITYYISNVHYNYWINFSIPVCLLCIVEVNGKMKVLWRQITEQNIKKTKTRWKLDIPFALEFNFNSFARLIRIPQEHKSKLQNYEVGAMDYFEQLFDKTFFIDKSLVVLEKIDNLYAERKENDDVLLELLSDGYDKKLETRLLKKIHTNYLKMYSEIQFELNVFAEKFGIGVGALNSMLDYLEVENKTIHRFKESKDNLSAFKVKFVKTYSALVKTQRSLDFEKSNHHYLRKVKKLMSVVLSDVSRELKAAINIMTKLENYVEFKIKNAT